MGNDAERADQRGDLDLSHHVLFPEEVVICVRPGDLRRIVSWCRDAWPDQEDLTWGWDFSRRATAVPRDLLSIALSGLATVDYRFWFDRPDDATWFSMVWG